MNPHALAPWRVDAVRLRPNRGTFGGVARFVQTQAIKRPTVPAPLLAARALPYRAGDLSLLHGPRAFVAGMRTLAKRGRRGPVRDRCGGMRGAPRSGFAFAAEAVPKQRGARADIGTAGAAGALVGAIAAVARARRAGG